MTCAALEHLEHATCIPALASRLEHKEDDARRPAWNALRGLTDYDLGQEADEWKPVVLRLQETPGGNAMTGILEKDMNERGYTCRFN